MSATETSPPQMPPPLKLRCTSADCEKQLHCFRATKRLRESNQAGKCRYCGADLIDWNRVHRRDLDDVDFTLESLRRELVRHHFWHVALDQKAINHARRKGRNLLLAAVEARIRHSLGPAQPFHDGYQTPWEGSGNALHYGQHATGSCCRACVDEWHGIPRGRELSDGEVTYLSALLMRYIEDRIPLTDQGEFVPPIRRKAAE